jgi:RNA polymerase sigma factor (sigma-70 family)
LAADNFDLGDHAVSVEDEILAWRFNRGDTASLCRIYEKYRDDLLKVAAALLDDHGGIEDVLHDVIVDFAQTSGKFRLKGSLKGYLAVCVANRARDRMRAIRRHGIVTLDEKQSWPTQADGPEHAAVSREQAQKLAAAITNLPNEQREAVVLHLQGRMPFREIAMLGGISVNTAMSRYRYGLEKLRSALDGELKP